MKMTVNCLPVQGGKRRAQNLHQSIAAVLTLPARCMVWRDGDCAAATLSLQPSLSTAQMLPFLVSWLVSRRL